MMHVVTFENHAKYNFKGGLEHQLEAMRSKGVYDLMVNTLNTHAEYLLNSIKYFGNGKMAQEVLKRFSNLVYYSCLPHHKCSYYYELAKEVINEEKSPYPSDDYCIELIYKLINLVKVQYNL